VGPSEQRAAKHPVTHPQSGAARAQKRKMKKGSVYHFDTPSEEDAQYNQGDRKVPNDVIMLEFMVG
jgi:hypothetical protein